MKDSGNSTFLQKGQLCWLKRYEKVPFLKKKSGIFSFRVNDILTSILSALHPFLTLPNDDLKREGGSRTFLSLSSDLMEAQKGTFFPVGSDVLKSAKMVPFCSWK